MEVQCGIQENFITFRFYGQGSLSDFFHGGASDNSKLIVFNAHNNTNEKSKPMNIFKEKLKQVMEENCMTNKVATNIDYVCVYSLPESFLKKIEAILTKHGKDKEKIQGVWYYKVESDLVFEVFKTNACIKLLRKGVDKCIDCGCSIM